MKQGLKRKLHIIIAFALTALISCVILSACANAPKDDSALRADGNFCVTFHCNGGTIGNHEKRTVYVKPGYTVPKPGEYNELAAPKRGSYDDFLGWYTGYIENGEVVFVKKWDFSKDKMLTEDFTLYAKWAEQLKCVVKYGDNFETEETIKYISHLADENLKMIQRPTREILWENHTFINYYTDETLNELCFFPFKHEGTLDDTTVVIYAKFIEGNYKLVYNPENLLQINLNTNLYLMNDVDMTGYTWSMPQKYQGTFMGNGYTISNISLGMEQRGNNNLKTGLFGTLGAAKFIDVSFENINVLISFNLLNNTMITAGLFAAEVTNETVFEGLSVSGTVTVIFNIPTQNPSLRADLLKYEGLFGDISEGADLSGIDSDINQYFIYKSSSSLSSADDLEEGGYLSVTLDSTGGSLGIIYLYMQEGTVLIEPGVFTSILDKPYKNSYEFAGWFTGTKTEGVVDYLEEWNFENEIDENLTLYAKWTD